MFEESGTRGSLLGLIIQFGPINEFLKKCLINQNKTVLHYIEIANRKVFFVIGDPIDSVQVNWVADWLLSTPQK